MIHLNKGEGKPHEWLTEDQFKERYPDLHRILNEHRDYRQEGERLKNVRVNKSITLRKMSEISGISIADLSRIESGKREATQAEIDQYCML